MVLMLAFTRVATADATLRTNVSGWSSANVKVAAGYTLPVTATVTTGTSHVTRTVQLQRKLPSAKSWTTLATIRTSSRGVASLGLPVPTATAWQFRLLVLKTATNAAFTTTTRTIVGVIGMPTAISGFTTTPVWTNPNVAVTAPITVKTGTGYGVRTIQTQRKLAAATSWTVIATGTTTRAGVYTARLVAPAAGTWQYRLVVLVSIAAKQAVTAVRTVNVAALVPTDVAGWTSTTTQAIVGASFGVPVVVTTGGGHQSRTIQVQRKLAADTAWSTVTTASTTTAGTYTASLVLPSNATWQYRLSVPATTTAAAYTTPSRSLAPSPPATVPCTDPLTIIFDTTLTGEDGTASNRVDFNLTGGSGVTVDWGGNGNPDPVGATAGQLRSYPANPGQLAYTYTVPGTYTVRVCGSATHLDFRDPHQEWAPALIHVTSFGPLGLTDLSYAFAGATNLISVPATLPDSVTNLHGTFQGAWSFNQSITGWNTTHVTNMSDMFNDAHAFNQPLASWDTSHVTNMSSMFMGASHFDQPIGNWDTSSVTDMSYMFSAPELVSVFNEPVASWDTSHVTNMSGMFLSAQVFNQPLGAWDVSNVTSMGDMFTNAVGFSAENYDNLLQGWANETVQPHVRLDMGETAWYDTIAQGAYDTLTTTDGWTITDFYHH